MPSPELLAKGNTKLVGELRSALIDIRSIDGIDFVAKKVNRDSRFRNIKAKLRTTVMKSLAECDNPRHKPPIEIWVEKGGRVHLLDGDHRVIDNIKKLAEADFPEQSPWWDIPAYRPPLNEHEARLRAMQANDPFKRGNLEEPEMIEMVERCRYELGMTEEEVVSEIGANSKRLVQKIEAILNATPDVLEAAKAGQIDIVTGARIAEEKSFPEQGAAVAAVVAAAERNEGDQRKARKEAGLGVDRMKPIKLGAILALLWPMWIDWQKMMEGTIAKDEETMVAVGTILRVLGMPPDDGRRQPSDPQDTTSYVEIVGKIEPLYQEFLDREKNPPRARPGAQGKKRKKREGGE